MRGKLLLGAVVLLLLLTGCTAPRQIEIVASTQAAGTTVPEATEVSFPPNKGTPCGEGSDLEGLTFEATVYDREGMTIRLDWGSFESQWGGFEIPFQIENQTDRAVWISFDSLIVNGIRTPCVAFVDAAAGKTVSGILYISAKDAQDRQLARVVSLQCRDGEIIDADTKERIDVIEFEIAPEELENFFQPQPEGEVVLSSQDVEVIFLGLTTGSGGGQTALFWIQNDAPDDVYAEFSEATINGVPVNLRYSEKIFRGAASYVEVTVYPRELLGWGIDEVKEITVTVLLREASDPEAILGTATVTAIENKED